MASVLLWVLRFLHILSGVAWVGGAFIWSMVVAPRLLARGPPPIRRPVLEALIDALPRYFFTAGGSTLVFGILLLGTMYGWANFVSTLQSASYGWAIGLGLLLALGMLAEGAFIITPTSKKLLARMQSLPAPTPGAPPTPPPAEVQTELAALGKRMGMASMRSVLMGTIAVGLMTWAVSIHIGI